MLSGIVDFVTIIGVFFSKCRKNLIIIIVFLLY